MSFGSAPQAPDPMTTAGDQFKFNQTAAAEQNRINSYNQTNPYGSISYVKDPNSPSGYTVNTALSDPEQQLLNTQQGTQQILGNTAQDLARNTASMYGQAPALNISDTMNKLQGWQQDYVNPIFQQQRSNLEARLQNQGLTPGSQAYNNAMNLQARNEGDINNQFFQTAEPLAFNQAVTQYQLPLQTMAGMFGASSPQQGTFQQTPTATVQPPNYAGLAEQNYEQNNKSYMSNLAGMYGIGSSLAGAAGKALFGGWGGGGVPASPTGAWQ